MQNILFDIDRKPIVLTLENTHNLNLKKKIENITKTLHRRSIISSFNCTSKQYPFM